MTDPVVFTHFEFLSGILLLFLTFLLLLLLSLQSFFLSFVLFLFSCFPLRARRGGLCNYAPLFQLELRMKKEEKEGISASLFF